MTDLSAETMTGRELRVFIASCQLQGPTQLLADPGYEAEQESLAEIGWLVRVYAEVDGEEKLVGYRLSNAARAANDARTLMEQAEASVN